MALRITFNPDGSWGEVEADDCREYIYTALLLGKVSVFDPKRLKETLEHLETELSCKHAPIEFEADLEEGDADDEEDDDPGEGFKSGLPPPDNMKGTATVSVRKPKKKDEGDKGAGTGAG